MTSLIPNPRLEEQQRKEVQRVLRCSYIPLHEFLEEHHIPFSELIQFGYIWEMSVYLVSTSRLRLGPNGARFIREIGFGGTHHFRSYYVRPNCAHVLAQEIRFKRHIKRMRDRGEPFDFSSLNNLSILYSRS